MVGGLEAMLPLIDKLSTQLKLDNETLANIHRSKAFRK